MSDSWPGREEEEEEEEEAGLSEEGEESLRVGGFRGATPTQSQTHQTKKTTTTTIKLAERIGQVEGHIAPIGRIAVGVAKEEEEEKERSWRRKRPSEIAVLSNSKLHQQQQQQTHQDYTESNYYAIRPTDQPTTTTNESLSAGQRRVGVELVGVADQKIKVTVTSAPRHSQPLESVVVGEPLPLPRLNPRKEEEGEGGSQEVVVHLDQEVGTRERPEVAGELFEAGSESQETEGASSANQKQILGREKTLTRSERDNELRRIASQRRQKNNSPLETGSSSQIGKPTTSGEIVRSTVSQTAANNNNNFHSNKQQVTQPSQATIEPPNPKQLAIYINGKIRSNSIFCRSTSSNSFNSILNRLGGGGGGGSNSSGLPETGANQANERLASDSSEASSPGSSRHKDSFLGSTQLTGRARNRQRRKSTRRRPRGQEGSRADVGRLTRWPTRAIEAVSSFRQRALTSIRKLGEPRGVQSELEKTGGSCPTIEKSANPPSIIGAPDQFGAGLNQQLANATSGQQGDPQAPPTSSSFKLNPSSMFLRKAMRYYRIWIYCANLTILLGTLVFVCAALYVLSNFRMPLLMMRPTEVAETDQDQSSLQFRQLGAAEPALILAYLAVLIQAGLLQSIGCFGAIRMKERYIQAFWLLILALTVFDLAFLVYWLSRYDLMLKTIRPEMRRRLQGHLFEFGDSNWQTNSSNNVLNRATPTSHLDTQRLAFVQIINRLQSSGKCCGIEGARDFRSSRWRSRKEAELIDRLTRNSTGMFWSTGSGQKQQQLRAFIQQVPLVPASCCRPPASSIATTKTVPLDDSQRPKKTWRVPAWSPSMVADERTLPAILGSPKRRKLLEKAEHYRSAEDIGPDEVGEKLTTGSEFVTLARRRRQVPSGGRDNQVGVVASRVTDDEQVESRLIMAGPELESLLDRIEAQMEREDATGSGGVQLARSNEPREMMSSLRALVFELNTGNFRQDNSLGLSERQFSLIQRYLIEADERLQRQPEVTENHSQQAEEEEEQQQQQQQQQQQDLRITGSYGADSLSFSRPRRPRRSILAPEVAETTLRQATPTAADQMERELANAIRADPELSCVPISHLDHAAIYTVGCEADLRLWLDQSARILFVTGVCVLTVLKFCSLLLLRLEIREMIHKIRVLKGMATEYNALHDLEAYLPRPSVCAQAAELTPSGVAAALPAPTSPLHAGTTQVASAAAATSVSYQGSLGGTTSSLMGAGRHGTGVHRIGGSFSEAVVAAAAAAAAASGRPSITGLGDLGSSGRATSMKAFASMLAPVPLYPRSSSAHLHSSAAQLAHLGAGLPSPHVAAKLKGATGPILMPRRHTAVVCAGLSGCEGGPPALGSSAVAASTVGPLLHTANLLAPDSRATPSVVGQPQGGGARGPQLAHHRHSAHAVQTLVGAAHSVGAGSTRGRLLETGSLSIERQSSGESRDGSAHSQPNRPSRPVAPERQSSSGGNSSGNPADSTLGAEWRRSIH